MDKHKTIGIIGLGLMGGSLSMALKKKYPSQKIIGVDDKQSTKYALSIKAINQSFPIKEVKKCIALSDTIFLCTPIDQILALLPEISKSAKPGCLITDVGSTKRSIVKQAQKFFPPNIYFIGGHPMTGTEGSGINAANPMMFENAVYALTPSQQIPPHHIKYLGGLLEGIGAKVYFLSPALHDKIAAAVSHLPQLVAVSLVNVIAKYQKTSSHYIKLAAGGFRDLTRIASSPYDIWDDIIKTNNDEISLFIDEFMVQLQTIQKKLINKNLKEDFKNAAKIRYSIPKDMKGFLHPVYDLNIEVEDKPGMIADISTALAHQNINIKDIEVLKVRDG
ncbi:MAG: prephenate dehydrogenase/arogenate dehydrogenase family protein, partial [bacterium]